MNKNQQFLLVIVLIVIIATGYAVFKKNAIQDFVWDTITITNPDGMVGQSSTINLINFESMIPLNNAVIEAQIVTIHPGKKMSTLVIDKNRCDIVAGNVEDPEYRNEYLTLAVGQKKNISFVFTPATEGIYSIYIDIVPDCGNISYLLTPSWLGSISYAHCPDGTMLCGDGQCRAICSQTCYSSCMASQLGPVCNGNLVYNDCNQVSNAWCWTTKTDCELLGQTCINGSCHTCPNGQLMCEDGTCRASCVGIDDCSVKCTALSYSACVNNTQTWSRTCTVPGCDLSGTKNCTVPVVEPECGLFQSYDDKKNTCSYPSIAIYAAVFMFFIVILKVAKSGKKK